MIAAGGWVLWRVLNEEPIIPGNLFGADAEPDTSTTTPPAAQPGTGTPVTDASKTPTIPTTAAAGMVGAANVALLNAAQKAYNAHGFSDNWADFPSSRKLSWSQWNYFYSHDVVKKTTAISAAPGANVPATLTVDEFWAFCKQPGSSITVGTALTGMGGLGGNLAAHWYSRIQAALRARGANPDRTGMLPGHWSQWFRSVVGYEAPSTASMRLDPSTRITLAQYWQALTATIHISDGVSGLSFGTRTSGLRIHPVYGGPSEVGLRGVSPYRGDGRLGSVRQWSHWMF